MKHDVSILGNIKMTLFSFFLAVQLFESNCTCAKGEVSFRIIQVEARTPYPDLPTYLVKSSRSLCNVVTDLRVSLNKRR